MEFLGVGYQELILVLVLLLVVVGPERMPEVAYQIGRAVRTLQRYARVVRDEFKDEFDYLDDQVRTVRGELDSARSTLRAEQRQMEAEWRQATATPELDLLPASPPPATGDAPASAATTPPEPAAESAGTANGSTTPLVF